MITVNLTVSSRVQLSYDPECKEFKQAFKRYVKEMDENASGRDMVEWVAINVARWGCDNEIMGVGFVHDPLEFYECPEPWCGITAESYDESASCHINALVTHHGITNCVIAGDDATINHITIMEAVDEA